jgi:hypothetical protein
MSLPNELSSSDARRSEPLCLMVIGDDRIETRPLPASGTVTIGRALQCALHIDHDSISRQHAVLRIGETITIEDLGSAGGTAVGSAPVTRGNPVELRPGEPARIGALQLILQKRSFSARRQRIANHDYFMRRLAVECERALRTGESIALVRISIVSPETAVLRAVEDVIARCLRADDLMGIYAPGEYELMLSDTSAAGIVEVSRRIRERLEGGGVSAHYAGASCPAEAVDAHALLGACSAALGGVAVESGRAAPSPLIVEDITMKHLHAMLEGVATDRRLLISGETGVGKRTLAEIIQRRSGAGQPIYRVNCATLEAKSLDLPPSGTVFFDDVARLSTESKTAITAWLAGPGVSVRVISSSSLDLDVEVAEGRFPADLLALLRGVSIMVPPLRDRPLDLERLARAFVVQACRQADRVRVPAMASGVQETLRAYPWPGNLEELRNVMERAVRLCEGDEIEVGHLELERSGAFGPVSAFGASPSGAADAGAPELRREMEDYERQRIVEALKRFDGNQTHTAQALGISRRTLVARLTAWGMTKPRRRSVGPE